MSNLLEYDLEKIRSLKREYDISAFIETGTGGGQGVEAALKIGFEEIYTCEIWSEQIEFLQKKFENYPHVKIFNLESCEFLEFVCKKIEKNSFFWLDAHFPGADIGFARHDAEEDLSKRLPLENELEIIKKNRANFNDVIFCDDLFIYEKGMSSISLEQIRLGHLACYKDVFSRHYDHWTVKKEKFQTGIAQLFKK